MRPRTAFAKPAIAFATWPLGAWIWPKICEKKQSLCAAQLPAAKEEWRRTSDHRPRTSDLGRGPTPAVRRRFFYRSPLAKDGAKESSDPPKKATMFGLFCLFGRRRLDHRIEMDLSYRVILHRQISCGLHR